MKQKLSKTTSRYTAIETLLTVARDRQPVKPTLERLCTHYELSRKDRNLAKNLVYGILRKRLYLNHLLQHLCRQPLNKLKPKVYHALCVGLYQLFFLDRIPDSAAVNETVNALRKMKVPTRLTGFVNGVLRESIRQKKTLPAYHPPEKPGDILDHPQWLTRRWETNYGPEKMIAICRNNGADPPLTLRLDTRRIDRQDYIALCAENAIKAAPGAYSPASVVIIEKNVSVEQLPGFTDGLFHVQDQSAQLASYLLLPAENTAKWLDCCAGLGGKTIHIGEMVFGSQPEDMMPSITAIEPEHHRFQKLLDNIERLPWKKHLHCLHTSLEEYAATGPQPFDRILLDAPCSGTGVIGRHPDIRWNRREEELRAYAETQLSLLKLAAGLLRPGGVLVYATCSIEPEENQDVIHRFLKNENFILADCKPHLPETAWPQLNQGCFAPLPSAELDGFFAARITTKAG